MLEWCALSMVTSLVHDLVKASTILKLIPVLRVVRLIEESHYVDIIIYALDMYIAHDCMLRNVKKPCRRSHWLGCRRRSSNTLV
jgi:hypothetical protein